MTLKGSNRVLGKLGVRLLLVDKGLTKELGASMIVRD